MIRITVRAILRERETRCGGRMTCELLQREFSHHITESRMVRLLQDRTLDIVGECQLVYNQVLEDKGQDEERGTRIILETSGVILRDDADYFRQMVQKGWQPVITKAEMNDIGNKYEIPDLPDEKPSMLRTIPKPPDADHNHAVMWQFRGQRPTPIPACETGERKDPAA